MSMLLKRSIPGLALAAFVATNAFGQSLPTSQPKLLTIYREQIKNGHVAAHVKTESGWPVAFAKAKSPDYYLALTSMTGPNEAWFISPWDSYGSWGKSMQRDEANAELSAELERLSLADAEHLNELRLIEAVARPDLSHGAYPDMNKTRFWEITIMRVRPGHEAQFAAAAKVYKTVAGRAAPKMGWRLYEITAGMPGPTYLVFSSTELFTEFDNMLAEGAGLMKAMTPEETAVLQKFSAEGLINAETNRYRLDAKMSYVPAETRATDPTFWSSQRDQKD